jgi:xylan 1,4-beta-xylosidase
MSFSISLTGDTESSFAGDSQTDKLVPDLTISHFEQTRRQLLPTNFEVHLHGAIQLQQTKKQMMNRRKWLKQTSMVGAGLQLASGLSLSNTLDADSMVIEPKWGEKGSPIKHSWAGVGNIDQARWIMRSDVQAQLEMCQKEIGLKHLRHGNIFEDQLWVYDVDPSGYSRPDWRQNKRINWRNPFFIYDSLLERHINPIVGTYFLPTIFASGAATCYETKTNISPPKDLKAWKRFINDFIKAIVERYGINLVKSWYFEVWNEPNLKDYYAGMEEYWQLYRTAYDAIKSVDASLKIGGPSTAHSAYLQDMLAFGARFHCLPDFLVGHSYNNDSLNPDPLAPYDGPSLSTSKLEPNYTTGNARGVRKLLNEAGFKGEFHMNEWGLSWHPFRPERETANEAAYIVKTMKEVSQLCDYFAYWDISDIFIECGYGREAFHGNYGMISLDGLRKPSYFAHQLLCKLGDVQIPVENDSDSQSGAFVTRKGGSIRAIVFAFDINYTVQSSVSRKRVEFFLPGNVSSRTASITRIDSNENNILKLWKEAGSPAYPKREEVAFLRSNNNLKPSGTLEVIKDQSGARLVFEMEAPSVAYIEIDNR